MRSLGRRLRAHPILLYALIAALAIPYLLAEFYGAVPYLRITAVIILAIGVSVLIDAYRSGKDR